MKKRKKINLVEELTTYNNDYIAWPLQPVDVTAEKHVKKKLPEKPRERYVYIDPQSHAPYSDKVHVPFDLYMSPKAIVQTDPRACFEVKKLPKYKPRLKEENLTTVLPPQVSLDHVDDERLQVLLKYTYTGQHKILMETAALKTTKLPSPPNRVVAEAGDVRFKPNIYPRPPEGWLSAAKHWDCLQIRHLGDPFKAFWTRKGPEVECGCCCKPEFLTQETKDQIQELVCEDKLRLPYNVTMTSYMGYRPKCARGVPLEKRKGI